MSILADRNTRARPQRLAGKVASAGTAVSLLVFLGACGAEGPGEDSARAAGSSAASEPSVLRQAFAACTDVIADHLTPSDTGEDIAFSEAAFENFSSGDEFYFSFRSGMIGNAIRAQPDRLTGSMEPSASCIGSLGSRQITSVSVNGADVITSQGF